MIMSLSPVSKSEPKLIIFLLNLLYVLIKRIQECFIAILDRTMKFLPGEIHLSLPVVYNSLDYKLFDMAKSAKNVDFWE